MTGTRSTGTGFLYSCHRFVVQGSHMSAGDQVTSCAMIGDLLKSSTLDSPFPILSSVNSSVLQGVGLLF